MGLAVISFSVSCHDVILFVDSTGEHSLLLSVQTWLQHNIKERLPQVDRLIQQLRLKSIPQEVMNAFLESDTITEGKNRIS